MTDDIQITLRVWNRDTSPLKCLINLGQNNMGHRNAIIKSGEEHLHFEIKRAVSKSHK